MYNCALVLSSGRIFYGHALGARKTVLGEICFTTNATGYQHTLTDPSFKEQIIVFTFPHIGNVGINAYDYECKQIHTRGIVVREDIACHAHIDSQNDLCTWLKYHDITGIYGIDTRALTHYIRENTPLQAMICVNEYKDYSTQIKQLQVYNDYNTRDLVHEIIKDRIYKTSVTNHPTKPLIAVIDFGMKEGIIRSIKKADYTIEIIAGQKGFAAQLIDKKPYGIVLSNGPGNPLVTFCNLKHDVQEIINTNLPIFGICLGHQLLALALGCKTYKMPVGHRGSNHPVYDLKRRKVIITSQNHGFAVSKEQLPNDIEITHRSLFDNSIAGIKVRNRAIFSVQYHPEACPGPQDSQYLFEYFFDLIKNNLAFTH